MKRSILGVCLALFAASSFASGIGNSYGGEGGKGGAATATGGNATGGNATGGAGYGGSGYGGSVLGSGNSSNMNANSNTNLQGQAQGQAQGQIATGGQGGMGGQGGAGGSAVSGSTSGASSGSTAFSGGNTQTNQGNNSRNDSSASNANTVTVQGDNYESHRAPVSTAYAAPLAASNGTCQGSTSAGAQGVSFGVSFGSTWKDESCDMRYDAEALRAAGLPRAAQARLCQKAEIAKAMEDAGTPCPKVKTAAVAVSTVRPSTQQEQSVGYTGSDPVVRARLGLPPLK